MSDDHFIQELYKYLSPNNQWDGELVSIKQMFDYKLIQYGITQNQAEKLLKMEKRTLDGILDKSAKRVNVINLLKLGQFLGLDTDTLLKAYLNEISSEEIGELDDAKKKSYIVSTFDIKNLYKSGFLKSKSDFNAIEDRIIKYFGLKRIFDFTSKTIIPAFSRTKKSGNILMREFWVRSAYAHFEKIDNPNEYKRENLTELIPKIRPYTMNVEKGLKTVTQALYNIGITVIYQPQLTTTHIRGATFIVKDKPCVAITDLNKNYATLWFALIHELHHILYDFDEISRQVFHLTGEPDLFLLQEGKADEFSREFLLPMERSNYIYAFIDNPHLVADYAKENQVHPSLIYNFYCYDMEKSGKGNYWGRFKQFQPDIKIALRELNYNSFNNESIDETVSYLKEKVFNL